jgi:gliding motility-associated-like protein
LSVSGSVLSIPGISAAQAGSYKVFLFSGGCLGPADSVQVAVSPNPSLELGPDTTTCSGTPVVIGVPSQAGLSYQWTGGATSSTIQVAGSGQYFLTVTASSGCSVTDSITVTLNTSPEPLEVLRGSQTICENQFTSFKVLSRSGEQYNWTGPNGFSAVGDSILVGTGYSSTGTFTVQAVIGNCSGTAQSFDLVYKALPTLSVDYDSLVCKGKFKDVSAQATPGSLILWSNLSSGPQTQLSVGKQWVSAELNGCVVSDTFLIRNAGPTAGFITSPVDSLLEVFREVSFIDQTVAGIRPLTSWSWDMGSAGFSTEQNPRRTYSSDGLIDVRLIVLDQAGCSDTVVKTLVIGPPRGWFIPNLFTPNGDGDNDQLFIRDLEKFPGTSLRVVSRWGKVEADIADYKNDWTGEGLDEGIYFYTVRRSDGREFSGYIELKR